MNGWRWAVIILWLMPPVQAQSTDTSNKADLIGVVIDSHHLPVSAAKVDLREVGKAAVLTTQSDGAGVYRFSVNDGNYMVRAECAGKGEAAAGPLALSRGKPLSVDLTLKLKADEQAQFFDEPQFTVAGITDNTYRGGHGSDTVLRSAETLAKATASLSRATSNAADSHHALGESNERAGRPLEAVREFQRAAELNPSEPNLFDWGSELLEHRAPGAAAEVFTKGVQRFPQSVRMKLGVASAWYAAGSYDEAAKYFFEATDLNPSDPNPYRFLSEVQCREITQSDGYEERLARFARLQPENALANYYYAVSLWNRRRGPEDNGSADKARALLEKAIALDSHLGLAYLQLGIVEASEGEYGEAIGAYRGAIEAVPTLEEAHYRLSEAYKRTGDDLKAQQERALYDELSKQSAEKVERERQEAKKFVVALRAQSPAPQQK